MLLLRKGSAIFKEMISKSPDETIAFGEKLGRHLKVGDVIALLGDLGSGKTTFVKGLARGLGNKKSAVSSPSFVIIKEYNSGKIPLYHVDLYRLKALVDIDSIGLEEYIGSDGVCAIEWAERAEGLLPKGCIKVNFEHVNEKTRRIEIEDTCA